MFSQRLSNLNPAYQSERNSKLPRRQHPIPVFIRQSPNLSELLPAEVAALEHVNRAFRWQNPGLLGVGEKENVGDEVHLFGGWAEHREGMHSGEGRYERASLNKRLLQRHPAAGI